MHAPISSPILVTGGTGTLGRLVVPRLAGAGQDVRVLSRRPGGGDGGVTASPGHRRPGPGRGHRRRRGGRRGRRAPRRVRQGRRGQGPPPRAGGGAGRGAPPRLHLGRRRRPHPGRRAPRPRHVRLLRAEAGGRGDRRRLRRGVDDAAGHPVPRPGPDHGAPDGQAPGDPGAGRCPVPAGRCRGGGGPAGGAGARGAGSAWCRTWAARGSTEWTSWCTATCGPPAGAGPWCGSRPGRAARAVRVALTWPPTGRWGTGRGRTSSPSGWGRRAGSTRACRWPDRLLRWLHDGAQSPRRQLRDVGRPPDP